MRRKEREIKDRAELLGLLEKSQVMYLGLIDGSAPYVVPLHFGWAEEAGELVLYFHCAPEGRKIDCIRKNPDCFITVTGETHLIKNAEACGWSAAFESLMLEGEAEVLTNDEEKKHGLNALMRHYGFEGDPAYSGRMLAITAVCRIRVHSITGKRRDLPQTE